MADPDYDLIWNAIHDGLDNGRCPHGTQDPEPCIGCAARAVLRALVAEGRLQDDDAVTEWGWLSADTVRVYASLSEANARRAASRSGARKPMRRLVGPWLPAPDTDKISQENP